MAVRMSARDTTAALSFASINYRYPKGERDIFTDFDLRIEEGQFVSVVGPSGCGKTTLLRLAAGLARVTSGRISASGEVITGPTSTAALVFQNDTLLPWRTAERNVALGLEGHLPRKQIRPRCRELLERVGLGDAVTRFPYQLSGGMRQRVNLARALALDPTVLLMDEPFAALDAQTREHQQEHLLDVWGSDPRTTVLFVTHDIEEAIFLADRVIVLARAPGGISDDLAVDFPRPRDIGLKTQREFGRIVDHVKQRIREVQS